MDSKNNSGKWIVVSFGSHGKWVKAIKRLSKQVERLDKNLTFIAYDERKIKSLKEWKGIEKLTIDHPKGFGLWIWKPIIIFDVLQNNPEALGVIYLDAGCEINVNSVSKVRFHQYLDIVKKRDLLTFEMNLLEYNYTKHQTIDKIYPNLQIDSKQISATVIFVKNSNKAKIIINEWQNLLSEENNKHLIGNSIQSDSEYSLIAHRHDQSVLSLLLRKFHINPIPDETYWAPNWNNLGSSYPIWATRNHHYFSVTFFPKIQSFIRKMKRIKL